MKLLIRSHKSAISEQILRIKFMNTFCEMLSDDSQKNTYHDHK